MTNSSSTRPVLDQLRVQARAALAEQRADAALAPQVLEQGAARSTSPVMAQHPDRGRGRRRLLLGGGRDQHPAAAVGEQRRVPGQVEPAADQDHQRVVRQALALAALALLRLADHPPVALGAHRPGADHHRVDPGPQRDQHRGVDLGADRPRAPANRRVAVEGEHEVGDHVGAVVVGERDEVEARDLLVDRGLGDVGDQPRARRAQRRAVRTRSRPGARRWRGRRRRPTARRRTRRRGSRRARPPRWCAG